MMQVRHDNEQFDAGGQFDPSHAADLLNRSTRDAKRKFDPRPPVLLCVMAVLVLIGYGALWLTSHGQHPYRGPSVGAIVFIYAVVALCAIVGATVHRRAMTGISGASIRQQRIEGAAVALSVLGSPMLQGAMYHYHASHAIVYGVIPAAGPLIVIGTTLVGIAGIKADWSGLWAALIVVIAGMVALYVGPSGAWLVAGIGMFIAILAFALARATPHNGKEHTWAKTPSTP